MSKERLIEFAREVKMPYDFITGEPINLEKLEALAELVRAEALAEQPAQQEPKIDIYRSFEQWKSGNVLEHGVPRTEHYSEAQLDLVEMGWNYGYDAGRAVEQALDRKAENARELGLDYGVEQDLRVFAQINAMKQRKALAEQPAQQEPVAKHYVDGGHLVYPTAQRPWVGLTDEEIDDLHRVVKIRLMGTFDTKDIYRAIEQRLKEKNT
jgi:hypothetical protein